MDARRGAPIPVSGAPDRHNPHGCGYADALSTGKTQGCSSSNPQGRGASLRRCGEGKFRGSFARQRTGPSPGVRRRRRRRRRAEGRIPPHNLEAEESLLGADDAQPRGAHGRGRGAHRGPRLLQARARRSSTTRRYIAPQPRRTRRPGHGRRGAAAQRPARSARRPRDAAAHPGRHAGVGERRALRADRLRARRCCGSSSRPRATSSTWRSRSTTTSTRRSTAPSR